jgi:tetratricopeptide (TPR) repeat protein
MGVSNILRSSARALPVAVSLLTAAAWAQPGGMSTGGNTQRPLNVSGKVAMEDGMPPGEKVAIEVLCPPNSQIQGRTDLKGAFNVELGFGRYQGNGDASMSSSASRAGFGGQLSVGRTVNQVDGMSIIALMGCFLRAALPGYTSDQYDLGHMRAGDVNTNVGTLFLRPLGKDSITVVSATSLGAPRDAQKSVAKARDYIAKRQFADAETELHKAVQSYPKYAEAWNELGSALQSQRKNAEARKAYLESIACDAKFPQPYLSLARLSATEANWQQAADASAALVKLDPSAYPQGYYYNAVAQYNLTNYDKAWESAHQAVKLDTAHRVPLAEQLLGVLYSMRGDFKSAAEQYRNYLQHAPPDANVDAVKARLAEAESRMAPSGPK